MSLDYTGDRTATQAPAPLPAKNASPILHLPTDGEAANVASIWQEFKALADYADFMTHKAGILDQANTWTALQTHTAAVSMRGSTGDANAAAIFDDTITTRKLQHSYAGSTANGRIYTNNAGEIQLVTNAVWNTSGGSANKWTQDNAGVASARLRWDSTGQLFRLEVVSAGSAAWVDGAWSYVLTADYNGDVVSGRDFSSNRNITALAGNVEAQGTPAGSSGPGLGKFKRVYGTGTALGTGDFTPSAGWGGTTAKSSATGHDLAGTVTYVAGGGGKGPDPTVEIVFKDGTYTTAPTVHCWLQSAPAFADYLPLQWTVTATKITITYKTNGGNPSDGTYTLGFISVGR